MKRTKIDLVLGEAREMDYSAASMTSADRLATTPAPGELVFDSTDGLLYVGDGATPGGVLVGGTGEGNITAGYRLSFSGTTLNVDRYMPIETVDVSVSSPSVTMQAGHAYFINAQSKAVTLNTETIPDNHFGLEGHLEIFVSGTGYVVTGTNVVLSQPLEPDSVNNCTVRFHDGKAIISVEDHIAGYVVINGSTSGAGSLYYGISTASEKFIAFNDTLAGTVISLAGATANDEKHLVGNGYQDTILTGNVNCGTSKFTVANLGLQNVQVTGGTLTLGDAYIPSGSTVAVSGGGLAVEKVTGNGGVIDLGGTSIILPSGTTATASGCVISGGSHTDQWNGGGVRVGYSSTCFIASQCTFTSNKGTYGGAIYCDSKGKTILNDCVVSGNSGTFVGGINVGNSAIGDIISSYVSDNSNNDIRITAGAVVTINGSTIGNIINPIGGECSLVCVSSNSVKRISGGSLGVTITSGATLDLTGNSNATPIAPGGGVIIGSDVQIYPSAGSASAVDISGGTYTAITNGGVLKGMVRLENNGTISGNATIDLDGSYIYPSINANISGVTIMNTGSEWGMISNRGNATFTDVVVSGGSRALNLSYNSATTTNLVRCTFAGNSGAYICANSATLNLSDCVFEENQSIALGGVMTIAGTNTIGNITSRVVPGSVTISSGASINLTSSINPGGTGGITVLTGGCTVNGNAIPAGTYTSIDSNGTTT